MPYIDLPEWGCVMQHAAAWGCKCNPGSKAGIEARTAHSLNCTDTRLHPSLCLGSYAGSYIHLDWDLLRAASIAGT